MKVNASERFVNDIKTLSKSELEEIIEIYENLLISTSINEINSTPIVGFPNLHTIEFGNNVIGIQLKNDTIELAGIINKGSILSLFF